MLVLFINCLILSYGEKIIYHNNYRKFLIHRISSTSIESILFLVSSKNMSVTRCRGKWFPDSFLHKERLCHLTGGNQKIKLARGAQIIVKSRMWKGKCGKLGRRRKIIVARKGGHELGTICKFLFSSIHTLIFPILVNSLFAKIQKEGSSQMMEFHLFFFFLLRI